MQLGRAAGDVDGMRNRLIERAQTRIDRRASHHRVGAVRPCVDVAVTASHVAELAEVDLEDLEGRGRQPRPAGALQHLAESRLSGGTRLHLRDLLAWIRQRRTPR
jgi:hypothetical protein